MGNMNNEVNVTWSSIEKDYDYHKVTWKTDKSGIPRYSLWDENNNKLL